MFDTSSFKNCIQNESKKEFFVRDMENGVSEIIYNKNSDWHVQVLNVSNQSLEFLKIDHCVNQKESIKRCDFGLITKDEIYFVEIKNFKKNGLKNKKKKEARNQLIASINYFREKGLKDLLNTYAVVTLVPRTSYRRDENVVKIGNQAAISNFQLKCGCPNLYEGNLIKI
jgi:hypothetical protein